MEIYPKGRWGWLKATGWVVVAAIATALTTRIVDMIGDNLIRDLGLLALALFLPCALSLAAARAVYQWLSPEYRPRVKGRERGPNQAEANTMTDHEGRIGEEAPNRLAVVEDDPKYIQKDLALDQLRLRLVDLREVRDDISGTKDRLENTISFVNTAGSVLILDKFQQWASSLDVLNSRIEEISNS